MKSSRSFQPIGLRFQLVLLGKPAIRAVTRSTAPVRVCFTDGSAKSVGIIKFPARPILAAPDEHYCEECVAGDGIRRTNALVLSAPRLVVA